MNVGCLRIYLHFNHKINYIDPAILLAKKATVLTIDCFEMMQKQTLNLFLENML